MPSPQLGPCAGPALATPSARRLGGFLKAEEAAGKVIYPPVACGWLRWK
jgi:hypothetical protein